MATELDYTFRAMGSEVRLLIGDRLLPGAPPPLETADRERTFVWDFSDRLSRFRHDSELSGLNRNQRPVVHASRLLRAAVSAGLWAAQRSSGLVDPTLVRALERNGYDVSLDGAEPASLEEALAQAPPRRVARPDPSARWRRIAVDDQAGTIARPPGVMIDTGGTGKGLCADAVALRLARYTRFVVDCGGDIAVGGVGAQLEPYEIDVQHPLTRRVDRLDQGHTGRHRNVRTERAHLAVAGWWLLPPPAGPVHGLARLERTDRRNSPRGQRAGGGDALEDGAAARRSTEPARCWPSTAA